MVASSFIGGDTGMVCNKVSKGNTYVDSTVANDVMDAVMEFLIPFIPQTTIKRLVCAILLAAGLSVSRTAELSGLFFYANCQISSFIVRR